jgi:hypothetical protein
MVLRSVNASYSLYWDIVMDWGMMQDPYMVAQTMVGCTTPYMPANTVDTDGIMSNGSTPNLSPSSAGIPIKGHDDHVTPPNHLPHLRYRPCHHVCLRPRLRYGLTLSALIVIADAFLRFSWTLRFVTRFPTHDTFVLCTQFLEVFRRAIWNLLRVEWENIKQKNNDKEKGKHDELLEDREQLCAIGRLPNIRSMQQRGSSTTPVVDRTSVEMKSLLLSSKN